MYVLLNITENERKIKQKYNSHMITIRVFNGR